MASAVDMSVSNALSVSSCVPYLLSVVCLCSLNVSLCSLSVVGFVSCFGAPCVCNAEEQRGVRISTVNRVCLSEQATCATCLINGNDTNTGHERDFLSLLLSVLSLSLLLLSVSVLSCARVKTPPEPTNTIKQHVKHANKPTTEKGNTMASNVKHKTQIMEKTTNL